MSQHKDFAMTIQGVKKDTDVLASWGLDQNDPIVKEGWPVIICDRMSNREGWARSLEYFKEDVEEHTKRLSVLKVAFPKAMLFDVEVNRWPFVEEAYYRHKGTYPDVPKDLAFPWENKVENWEI